MILSIHIFFCNFKYTQETLVRNKLLVQFQLVAFFSFFRFASFPEIKLHNIYKQA